jgi:hypothetical protein
MHLRIRADEACGCTAAFGAVAGGSDHRIRNVNANAAAVRAESSRERECRAARTAAGVEHPGRGCGDDCFNEQVFKRLE